MKVRNFDIATARLGQTLRHVASQQCYTVVRVMSPMNGHDTAVTVKSPRGQFAFVGTEYVDPDQFVELTL